MKLLIDLVVAGQSRFIDLLRISIFCVRPWSCHHRHWFADIGGYLPANVRHSERTVRLREDIGRSRKGSYPFHSDQAIGENFWSGRCYRNPDDATNYLKV